MFQGFQGSSEEQIKIKKQIKYPFKSAFICVLLLGCGGILCALWLKIKKTTNLFVV